MTLRLIDGIRDLAPDYDGFILDLWGVVHDGTAPFPGVLDCMGRLITARKRIVLLSNAPRRRVLHIGSERDLEIREGLGLDFVETPAEADFILNTGPAEWEDTIADYAPILGAARECDLPMVCANPDLIVMHGSRLALCAGALAEEYERLGGRVRWHGKPNPSVYDSCLALMGIAERRRILAIGDSLRTDIAGAAGAGIDALLIAGGLHADEFIPGGTLDQGRIAAAIRKSGTNPIAVAARFVW